MTTGGRGMSCTEALRLILSGTNSVYDSYNNIDVFLDIDHVQPTSDERAVFDLVEIVLAEAERAFDDLVDYGNGAMDDVKVAIKSPDDEEAQRNALVSLKACFARTKQYFALTQRIAEAVPHLLWALCAGPLPPAEQIEGSQALGLQFARLVDFVCRFDAVKMLTPALMNDISFYRRMVSRSDFSHVEGDVDDIEQANVILICFSSPNPMLCCLVDAVAGFVNGSELSEANTTDTLATFVYICRHMLERKNHSDRLSPETQAFFTRVMVGAFILYDHTDKNGAFCRTSPIDVRAIVHVVRQSEDAVERERLLNALRYNSKHFNAPTTPKAVRSALEATSS